MTEKTIIGQLEVSVKDGEHSGYPVDLDIEEWKKLKLEPGCWVKYTEKEDGSVDIQRVNPCDYCNNGVIKRELD